MSRPPRPIFRQATAAGGAAFDSRGQFLPLQFHDLVDLQRALAEGEARLGVTGEQGDFSRTLFELSALVTHTLGLYQNLYAGESFLTTARTERSLVLHARRLAYEPDQGLAASGFEVLTIGNGLTGTLPEGFAVASSPRGEIKAQIFETIAALPVDAARNLARPVNRERPASLAFTGRRGTFWLAGQSLPLGAGGIGMLIRGEEAGANASWDAVVIVETSEDRDRHATRVVVDLMSGTSSSINGTAPLADAQGQPTFRFLALPREQLRRFGADADNVNFPTAAVDTDADFVAPETINSVDFGYDVTRDSGGGLRDQDLYLSTTIRANLVAGWVVGSSGNSIEPLKVIEQGTARVALRREGAVTYTAPDANGNNVTQSITVQSQIDGTVTYLCLQTHDVLTLDRWSPRLAAPLYADWQFDQAVLASEPNPESIPSPLIVDVDFGGFRPGGVVVFETLDGATSQVREVQKVAIVEVGTAPDTRKQTELHTIDLTGAEPEGGWTLDNIQVWGNVGRVTHGESHEEILGSSDGVTMFQRFELKKAPLTQVPGSGGGEPAIQVFVNDVEWARVRDFFGLGAHDRVYRLEFDEQHTASVIFGNGITGAIPPTGRKHIRAVYRQGLGVIANVDARAASRIKKAHPLVTRATNATAMVGGADPAALSDLKRQAVRFIRTFDRAVSIQDHADLALLFPGVARAAARPFDGGVEVIVATVDGGEPPLDEVGAFLDARRDETLPLSVRGPEAVDIWLDVVIEHDPALLTENVKRAVQEALVGADARGPGLFTFQARDFGQAAHLSEVYERLGGPHGVEGVTLVDVTRFRIGDLAGGYDVLKVNARQWLRLPAANLTIQITPGAPQ